MLAHALSVHQTSHRREASSGRQFGVLPCFWAYNTICDEVWEHVEHASDALIKYNPDGGSWEVVMGQYDKPLPAYAGLDMERAREQADDVPDMQVLNYAETTGMPEVIQFTYSMNFGPNSNVAARIAVSKLPETDIVIWECFHSSPDFQLERWDVKRRQFVLAPGDAWQ